MSRPLAITLATLLCCAASCGPEGQEPISDSGDDVGTAPDQGVDTGVGPDVVESACAVYDDLASCAALLGCTWERDQNTCLDQPADSVNATSFAFTLEGTFPAWDGAGTSIGEFRNLDLDGAVHGSFEDQMLSATRSSESGTIEFQLHDATGPTYLLGGWFDGQRVVFDDIARHPEAPAGTPELGSDTIVMVPRDGWQPTSDINVRPGGGDFVGEVGLILVPGRVGTTTCSLAVSEESSGNLGLASWSCDTPMTPVTGEAAFDADSRNLWFAVELDGTRYVLVGFHEGHRIAGVVVRDDGVWSSGPPAAVSDVDPTLVVGTFDLGLN